MIWYAVPSARAPEETADVFAAWRAQGYQVALWRDPGAAPVPGVDLTLNGPYCGYHTAINTLCREILKNDPEADWIVTGGDDIFPDPNHSGPSIAAECTAHFGGTFGVMQPTGDPWAHPDRICGSPFMGREFCRRMYGGRGPWCEAYPHMWGDEEMHDICLARGILWNRPDLAHYHRHFQRGPNRAAKPAWMVRNDSCYEIFKPLFQQRKAAGFPGHVPIP